MKMIPRLFWEKPGEKEKFGELIKDKDTFEAITLVSDQFGLDFMDAKTAIETYNKYINKDGKD